MYEKFGAVVAGNRVTFNLFFPDNLKDPSQYSRGGSPQIARLQIAGTFQSRLGGTDWDAATAPDMVKQVHPKGWLYTFSTSLPDGYYDYKYIATFEQDPSESQPQVRWVNDPCTKYGGADPNADNSAFVIGGQPVDSVKPIAERLPQRQLVAYELMIDDFVSRDADALGMQVQPPPKAPLDIVADHAGYLVDLGVNAVEFMPWTAWKDKSFSWGYNPCLFFSVEARYTNIIRAGSPKERIEQSLEQLSRLKNLIETLHGRGIHVILDGVFNHTDGGTADSIGFPYKWLYKNPENSPYIGSFSGGGFFDDFNFANRCTQEFIFDVCRYWIERFSIDGIRFDYTRGFFSNRPDDPGISRLISNIRGYTYGTDRFNFALIIEQLPDNRYQAIDDTNRIGAFGCWFDPIMFQAFGSGRDGNIGTSLMRALDANRDFAPGNAPMIYIENHDHGTLVNKLLGNKPQDNDRNQVWFKTQPWAITLLTMPGTVLIHNGQEFGDEYYMPENGDGRVVPRPVRWELSEDRPGKLLRGLYSKLISIRNQFPALSGPNFFPSNYNESSGPFSAEGYGIDTSRRVVIYHRWGAAPGSGTDYFIVVANFSNSEQVIDVPFSFDGAWKDLLDQEEIIVSGHRRANDRINSNWGKIYYARR